MAAMKFLALRNPKERWLIDLVLLFIPSTAPLERRSFVQGRMPSRWERNMRTNFLNGSSRERMAEFIHLRATDPGHASPVGSPRTAGRIPSNSKHERWG